MEQMILDLLKENTGIIATAVSGLVLHAGASLTCALTRTPRQRARFRVLYRLLEAVALNVGRAKEENYR